MQNFNVNNFALVQAFPHALHQLQPANPQRNYKSRLQEYAHRFNIELPSYETVIESGAAHLPNFRATVSVGGGHFTTQRTFCKRKLAEQQAARVALETLIRNQREQNLMGDGVVEDFSICKSIMNEYALKLRQATPTYTITERPGELLPFVSTLNFNGGTYNGNPARNKKIAMQFAARAAIISILAGNSRMGQQLYDIIQSKCENYDAAKLRAVEYIHAQFMQLVPMEENVALIENDSEEEEDKTSEDDEVEGANGLLYLYNRELELIKMKENNANK